MMRVLRWITALLILGLCAVSLLPLVETNIWWVRFLDFPRLQFGAALLALLLLWLILGGWRGRRALLLLPALAALGYHGWKLWPYQPLAAPMVATAAQCDEGDRLRVLIANVQRSNRDAEAVIALARAQKPDIFFVMEINAWWDAQLSALDADFPYHVQAIPDEATYFGLHAFSRHPMDETEIRHPLGADTPMLVTTLRHPARDVRFIGVHPRPPQQGQPSTIRDAVVLDAAVTAARSDVPAIVAGDYNGTPWERTARRAMRIGGLVDPRVGRGLAISFDHHSAWMKWPLDQILWQPGPALLDFAVMDPIGSDHLPVQADLCLTSETEARVVPRRADDMEEAQTSFDAARALNGVAD
ncbi:endonuclease/exonuclease/phosphatase family protein [Pseudoroseicyclus aestuarii]|uniref:Endonuclease/exonuclease/phosphatase (EEP) superfamily protein YafD n=1 Tax=Pseudoroseicyclus aestuarii TaxID=1795041 RepID=A0A318SVE6_9RHOB|nr:endonuclease/exonuclease/phosphatase family protein [Pseudoroseicyclus aestuarii]PYE85820.1 endonuclease/exonuclease/phosphatase (EEP) superfamily protein YafD [Pseudoroseicyclus aestuarii]